MSALTGADVDELERSAAHLEAGGTRIGAMRNPLRSQLHSSHWHGGAADRFRGEWDSTHGPALAQAEDFLRGAGQRLRIEADEQRQASNMGGGGAGASSYEQCRVTPEASRAALNDRYRASQEQIATRIAEIDARTAQINHELDGMRLSVFGVGLIVNPYALKLMYEAKTLSDERNDLEELQGDDRQIMSLNSGAGDQRVVDVYGDLANAAKVIIHVPGMSTDLDNYGRHDNGQTGHPDARFLQEAAQGESGQKVAVVSFADYDIPRLGGAALGSAADGGAEGLRALVADLRAMGYDTSQISVVGHSYGSVVIGHAMKDGLAVREVVVAGGPGMGATRAEMEAGSPGVRLTAVQAAPGDPVPGADNVFSLNTPGPNGVHMSTGPHGISPDTPGFGADRVIQTNGNHGHSEYFKDAMGREIALEAVN